MEWFTDEQMASFQRAADEGRASYERRQRAKASKERAEMRKKQKALGIKVIRGGKPSE